MYTIKNQKSPSGMLKDLFNNWRVWELRRNLWAGFSAELLWTIIFVQFSRNSVSQLSLDDIFHGNINKPQDIQFKFLLPT